MTFIAMMCLIYIVLMISSNRRRYEADRAAMIEAIGNSVCALNHAADVVEINYKIIQELARIPDPSPPAGVLRSPHDNTHTSSNVISIQSRKSA